MSLRSSAAALLALPLLTMPATAQMITPTAEQVAEVFCIGRIGNDDTFIRATLTPELLLAIEAALSENTTLQQATPDEKPPLGDGIPWSSYPDYAPTCTPAPATGEGDTVNVRLTYAYADGSGDHYIDTLVMVRSGDALRIDNIEYETGGNLRDLLASVFNF